jgi:hypothetical protein
MALQSDAGHLEHRPAPIATRAIGFAHLIWFHMENKSFQLETGLPPSVPFWHAGPCARQR